MKKQLLLLLLPAFLLFATSSYADPFCDGFERGYITGYKQASGSSFDPLTPLCPLEPLPKLNDPESPYERGYLLGLKAGLAAGRR